MTITTTAHVNSRGHAREMLEFYRDLTGGDLSVATYAQTHGIQDGDQADQVSFGVVSTDAGFRIMGYDVQPEKDYEPGVNAFYVVISGDDPDEVRRLWDGLTDGAREVLIPLGPAPFQPLYGMVTDRFGVTWILGANGQ